ncbi:MAG: hypothetical protein IPP07_23005 [Holophagales bacterium]|nr:hypothetical protein [Holophagales bacterium]MBK9967585.1 hypothetical protein [Holophagales bacterium]
MTAPIGAAKARAAVAGVFVAGFLCGAAVVQTYRSRLENRLLSSPHPMAEVLLRNLDDELSLSPEQERVAFDAIVATREEAMRLIDPRKVEALFLGAEARIAATLDPKQRARFARLVAARKKIIAPRGAALDQQPAPSPGP